MISCNNNDKVSLVTWAGEDIIGDGILAFKLI